jgi:hypothetical protein
MNPATRLRTLCITAALAYIIECGLIFDFSQKSVDVLTIWGVYLASLASLLGVAVLWRPGRFLFPVSLLLQLALAGVPVILEYPIALIPGLLGFAISLVILVFLFTSPTKQLFIPRDPDAPVE